MRATRTEAAARSGRHSGRPMARCGVARIAAAAAATVWMVGWTPAYAEPPCLNDNFPIEGELQEVRTRSAGGKELSGYVLQLGGTACAEVTDKDGAPAQLLRVRTVQIIASDMTGARALERLLGLRIRVIGHLDAPDPERHAGHAVLSNAELLLVLSRAGRGFRRVPKGGLPPANGATDDLIQTAEFDGEAPERGDASSDDRDGGSEGYQEVADRRDVERRLASFVEGFYLSGEPLDETVIRTIYAQRVDYFGKRNTAVRAIAKDKLAYYERWPVRQFALLPGTLEVRPVDFDGTLYDLTFMYDFRVAAVGRESAGRGYGRLLIDLAEGEGKIIRESGKVITRN